MKRVMAILLTLLVIVGIAGVSVQPASATARLVTKSATYYGLSSDTKPTLTAPDAGAIFKETDTGSDYVWHGTAWVPISTGSILAVLDSVAATGAGKAFATYGYTTLSTACAPVTSGTPTVRYTLQGRTTGAQSGWVNLRTAAIIHTWVGTDSLSGAITPNVSAWDSVRVYVYTLTNTTKFYIRHKFAKEGY